VHAKQFPASGTGPFLFLITYKPPDSKLLYCFKIIKHAHPIFCPISLIQLLQASTWKSRAFTRAILSSCLSQVITISKYTTASIFRRIVWFASNSHTAWACIHLSHIAQTQPTIHPARRYKINRNRSRCRQPSCRLCFHMSHRSQPNASHVPTVFAPRENS